MDDSGPREERTNGTGCDLRLLRCCEAIAIWKGVKKCALDELDGGRTAMHGPHVAPRSLRNVVRKDKVWLGPDGDAGRKWERAR